MIVAGGIAHFLSKRITRAVEILHINDNHLPDSYWSVVEQLPYNVYEAVPLIINDNLYIAGGFCGDESICSVVTASISKLLNSSDKSTSNSQVWNKLPDMPYSSFSINHYQGHLITFTGDYQAKKSTNFIIVKTKPTYELVPLVYIYNPDTKSWQHVGEVPCEFLLGVSVHIKENRILFIGDLTGSLEAGKDSDHVTTCLMLTLTPQ